MSGVRPCGRNDGRHGQRRDDGEDRSPDRHREPRSLRGVRTQGGDPGAHAQASGNRDLIAAAACNLDATFVEEGSVEREDDSVSIVLEDRFGGNEQHAGHAVGRDACRCRHPGADPRIGILDRQGQIEILERRPACAEVDLGEHGDVVDRRGEIAALHRFDMHRCRLADLQAAPIGFVQVRLEVHGRHVGQLDDLRAWPDAVALPELDVRAEHATAAVVRHDARRARRGRLQLQRIQPVLRLGDVELRLLPLALLGHDVGLRRGRIGRSLGFDLAHLLLRVGHGELRLLVFHARHDVALAEVESRAIQFVARVRHVGPILLLGDPLLRLDLLDFPFGLFQLGLLFLQPLPERRGVELDDDVAGLHGAAVPGEPDDLQLACAHRRREDRGPGGANLSADFHVIDEVSLRHDRRRKVGCRANPRRERESPGGHDEHGGSAQQDAAQRPRRHCAAPMSVVRTMLPAVRPLEIATCCASPSPSVTFWRSNRPPRRTST